MFGWTEMCVSVLSSLFICSSYQMTCLMYAGEFLVLWRQMFRVEAVCSIS